jgi:serum/glucocorticoid-regulated kinase 2
MLSVQDNFRTHTIIGTPAYMAPEVFSGSAYSFEADLWSIGVMFYEFLTGKLPFGQMSDDPMDISEEIMYMPVDIPANL